MITAKDAEKRGKNSENPGVFLCVLGFSVFNDGTRGLRAVYMDQNGLPDGSLNQAALSETKEKTKMNKNLRKILFSLTLAALLAASTLLAFAKEIDALSISGPGIKGEASFNDPDGMLKLMDSGFFDQASFIKAPENLGQGYTITAFLNLDGKSVPFVQMVYYPADSGQTGYVHYTGRLNGDSMETTPVDQWAAVPAQAGTAFSELMTAHGIALQAAVVASPAKTSPVAQSARAATPNAGYIALAAGIVILIGAALLSRRKAVGQRRSSVAD